MIQENVLVLRNSVGIVLTNNAMNVMMKPEQPVRL
jgi:hypothetical protein